jgi:uncharacterized protein YcfJ
VKKALVVGLTLISTSVSAFASHDDNYQDQGRVISVTQQFERVNTPSQECRTEYVRESVYEPRERSFGGAIIGGVTGGLLGSTIGRGKGRVAAAAVGAGIGAIVGDRVDNNRRGGYERVETRPVESCVTVDNWHQVPAGYLVNYEYNGRQYTTVTQQDPGRFIPVNVQVRPGGYVTNVSYNDRDDDRWERGERRHGRGHRKHDRNYW